MIDGSNVAIEETVPAVVTVAEAANLMKVHEQSVRNFIRDGRLKAIKRGRYIRIKVSTLREFMSES